MSRKEDKLHKVLDSDDSNGQFGGAIIGLIVGLITIVVLFFLWKRRRVVRRGICFVGLCESGKTLIYSQLIYKKAVESFTSMKENIGIKPMGNKGPLTIVDVPGHERVRQRFFDTYKSSARGIVFVLDSLSLSKDIRDVAEYLYQIVSDSVVISNRPPVLVLCNKQDHALAKGSQVIRTQLEKEMNVLRNTKSNQLEAISEAGGKKTYLGREGKDFEFIDLLPLKVDFAASSAQTGDLEQLEKWLDMVA
nr:EOG090X0C7N [Eurycercus lamellatus]